MDIEHPAIKSLYQDEIGAYRRQIDELKERNRSSDEKNSALLRKVQELQDLVEKAEVANKDLHTAFEHVRQENMKLQRIPEPEPNEGAVMAREREEALEVTQKQYLNLTRASVSWLTEKDKLHQRVKFLERECERYERDNKTLGKQVRHLLRSLEEERGMIIRRAAQAAEYQGQPGNMITASDVIDNHLVTFESIEEMQLQNQKLLSLVKDLSEREETREIQTESEDVKRLTGDIQTLKNQLESVKEDRERIMNAFNTINKERDLFKILLTKTRDVEHMTPEIFQRMVSIACSAAPAITNEPESTESREAHIADLKATISKLEDKIDHLVNDLEVSKAQNEEEMKLKTDLLEKAHLKILSESKQVEALNERNKVLEANIQSLQTEFDEVRTKSQKMVFELEQLAKDKETLQRAIEEEERKTQAGLATILNEIQVKSEQRFELQSKLQEAESVIRNLETNLQELASRCQQQAVDHNQQVEDLTRGYEAQLQEMDTLNKELDAQVQHLLAQLEQQKHAQENNNQIEEARLSLEAQLKQLDSANKGLEAQVQQLTDQLNHLRGENKQHNDIIPNHLEEISRLQNCLSDAEGRVCKLEIQLRESKLQIQTNLEHITELQRLRNIERAARLELARKNKDDRPFPQDHQRSPSQSSSSPEEIETPPVASEVAEIQMSTTDADVEIQENSLEVEDIQESSQDVTDIQENSIEIREKSPEVICAREKSPELTVAQEKSFEVTETQEESPDANINQTESVCPQADIELTLTDTDLPPTDIDHIPSENQPTPQQIQPALAEVEANNEQQPGGRIVLKRRKIV